MDQFDEKIIRILTENARVSVTRIAKIVNLSRTAVDARIKKMEQSGLIVGYRLVLGKQGGRETQCFLTISLNGCSCEQAAPHILKFPEVSKCYSVAGEVDLIVYLETDSMKRILEIIEKLESLSIINKIRTHVILADRMQSH
jgi:DNA-binding Lrp family transcriptional regulator